jgi:hypothetical protein
MSLGSNLEFLALCAGFLLAFLLRGSNSRRIRRLSRAYRRLAWRPGLAVAVVGLLALTSSALLSCLVVHPQPFIHDEFSYLLAADTFAHGRLTNPPHPLWEHFESFHILQQPTYASKYPPAQGLVLALGQVLAGSPLAGVWLSVGLCCGALCWMLQAWLPPRWALGGALLLTGRIVLLGSWVTPGYWSQSYWGGAVAAFGGALVFGALRRVIKRPAFATSLLLGLGVVILANSRPFEGLIAALPAAILLLVWMARKDGPCWSTAFGRVIAPICLVLVPAALAMAYYNARVTGSPFRLPYVIHEKAYAVAPTFLWQPLRPAPEYHHEVVKDFWTGWACEAYQRQQSFAGFLSECRFKLWTLWSFFLGLTLTIPLVAIGSALRDRWTQFALLTCGLLLAALLLEQGVVPHYAAPVTGLVGVLMVQSVRQLSRLRIGVSPIGLVLVPAILLSYGIFFLGSLAPAMPYGWFRHRARIQAELEQTGERHLIVVRYSPQHNGHAEWVYNAADIDLAPVVWAREMDAPHNWALLAYFKDRHIWLLEADAPVPELTPYRSP